MCVFHGVLILFGVYNLDFLYVTPDSGMEGGKTGGTGLPTNPVANVYNPDIPPYNLDQVNNFTVFINTLQIGLQYCHSATWVIIAILYVGKANKH